MRTLLVTAVLAASSYIHGSLITVDGAGSGDHITIAAGVAAAAAGDTVLVKDGVYDERITVATPGESGNRLVIRSENLHGAQMRGFVINADYISVEQFEITGTATSSRVVEDAVINSSNAWLRVTDCHIHDVQRGAAVYTGPHAYIGGNLMERVFQGVYALRNTVVENNRIIDLFEMLPGEWVGRRDNLYIFIRGDSITCRGNYLWNDQLIGDFFKAYEWRADYPVASADILIENNVCFQAKHGCEPEGMRRAESARWTFRNNVFVNTMHVGICMKYMGTVKVLNNTFINCGAKAVWFGTMTHGGNEIKNNIFAYTDVRMPESKPGDVGWIHENSYPPEVSHNLYYNTKIPGKIFEETEGRTFEPDFVSFTPLDTATADFRLNAACEAVDAGIDAGVMTDHDGKRRPLGGGVDIGAFEYGIDTSSGMAPVPAADADNGFGITPMPVGNTMTVNGVRNVDGLRIVDAAGRTVWRGSGTGTRIGLQGRDLAPGRYVLVSDDGSRITAFTITR